MNRKQRQRLVDEAGWPFTPIAYETTDGQAVVPPLRWGVISTPADARVFVEHANHEMEWENSP